MNTETLSRLCHECKNWFTLEEEIQKGTFSISEGALEDVDFLQAGQYFRIVGSVFNDGVHKFGATPPELLQDETFSGAVWPMRVPLDFLALAAEVEAWETEYGEGSLSPYQSESFGGYSYTKASGGGGSASAPTWESIFGGKLGRWRKL